MLRCREGTRRKDASLCRLAHQPHPTICGYQKELIRRNLFLRPIPPHSSHVHSQWEVYDLPGRMFAFTRSSNSSRLALSLGMRPLCHCLSDPHFFGPRSHQCVLKVERRQRKHTRLSHLLISSAVHSSGSSFDISMSIRYKLVFSWSHTSSWIWFRRKHIATPYPPSSNSCYESRKPWMPC